MWMMRARQSASSLRFHPIPSSPILSRKMLTGALRRSLSHFFLAVAGGRGAGALTCLIWATGGDGSVRLASRASRASEDLGASCGGEEEGLRVSETWALAHLWETVREGRWIR